MKTLARELVFLQWGLRLAGVSSLALAVKFLLQGLAFALVFTAQPGGLLFLMVSEWLPCLLLLMLVLGVSFCLFGPLSDSTRKWIKIFLVTLGLSIFTTLPVTIVPYFAYTYMLYGLCYDLERPELANYCFKAVALGVLGSLCVVGGILMQPVMLVSLACIAGMVVYFTKLWRGLLSACHDLLVACREVPMTP